MKGKRWSPRIGIMLKKEYQTNPFPNRSLIIRHLRNPIFNGLIFGVISSVHFRPKRTYWTSNWSSIMSSRPKDQFAILRTEKTSSLRYVLIVLSVHIFPPEISFTFDCKYNLHSASDEFSLPPTWLRAAGTEEVLRYNSESEDHGITRCTTPSVYVHEWLCTVVSSLLSNIHFSYSPYFGKKSNCKM